MIVYYSSKTGNTKKFVMKLEYEPTILLKRDLIVSEPYVLIIPTYADGNGKKALSTSIVTFLNKNREFIRGVVAGGNRNFGQYFGYAGDIVSYKCNVELLHKFELTGNDEDVRIVKEKIRRTLGH